MFARKTSKDKRSADKAAASPKPPKHVSYVAAPVKRKRRSFRNRLRVLGSRRFVIAAMCLLLIGLVVFAEIVRPDQDARHYSARLQNATVPLEACFDKLTDTTRTDIFYAPDIAIQDRQRDAAAITTQVEACHKQLNSFSQVTDGLLALHFAGYTQTYHQAKVNQHQAQDIIGQSSDVLNQYGDLAATLTDYYAHIKVFLDDFDYIQKVEYYQFPTRTQINQLATNAKDLHQRALDIRQIKSTSNFDATKLATADMFDHFAAGLDQVVTGYSNFSDYYKHLGFTAIDKAVADYDATVVVLPFTQLKQSYVTVQVQQLPVKVHNLLAGQKE